MSGRDGANGAASTGPTGNTGPTGRQGEVGLGAKGDPSNVPGPTGNTGPTGSFQTDYAGQLVAGQLSIANGANVSSLVVYHNAEVQGDVVSTSLWSGVQTVARQNSIPMSMFQLSVAGGITYQHLGQWTAPINGHFIKINYLHAQYFNVNVACSVAGVRSATGPTLIDMNIVFNTSNSNDYIQVGGIPNVKFYGYGYAISTHCTAMPYSVWVSTPNGALNPTSQSFDFYVQTGPYVGAGMVSALTTDTWTPETGSGISSTLPLYALQLPLASNMHSMNISYLTR